MTAETLKDVYADELKDLWSANDQMIEVVEKMAHKATAPELKAMLLRSVADITKHAASIKALLVDADEKAKMDHCRGMEGLIKEATKHITKEAPDTAALLDIVIIAQFQRMSHYGLAGFGTAAAYAKALGMADHQTRIDRIVADIHKGDEYATTLAVHAETLASSESKAA